jgi:xylitol oxidase
MTARPTNWAGNITYEASAIRYPESVAGLQAIVAHTARVRALGTGHSFNRIADTPGELVSLAAMPAVIDIDPERRTVRVGGGLRYGEVAARLQSAGYALHNTGSLPHISVAGACAAGTHGSGDTNGNVATAVAALEIVRPDGDVEELSRGCDEFPGTVVALGSLGIVSTLTLDIEPTYDVRQYVYENLSFERFAASPEEVFGAGYSVSLFTNWQRPAFDQVWVKRRVDQTPQEPPQSWLGAGLANGPRHPVSGMPPANATRQLGVAGPWHERLPHFRLDFMPSTGDELQTEYLVGRSDAVAALDAVWSLAAEMSPVLLIAEIRTIAADELWMSPSYRRHSVALHFTWRPDLSAVLPVVALIESALAPFQPRPHWGKVFSMDPDTVASCYDRRLDFLALLERHDPRGKFRNEMIDRFFPPS